MMLVHYYLFKKNCNNKLMDFSHKNGMNRVLMQEKIEKCNINERVWLYFFHWDSPSLSFEEKEELEWRTKKYTFCEKCNMFIEYIISCCLCC